MTIAPVIPVPVKPAAHNSFLAAPPATPAAFRYAAQSPDLDELVAVGLTLHLFTEVLHGRVGLCLTEMHRAIPVQLRIRGGPQGSATRMALPAGDGTGTS